VTNVVSSPTTVVQIVRGGAASGSSESPSQAISSPSSSSVIVDAIDRARAGDFGAFAVVFEQFAPMVHGVLLARAGNRQDVDDLVQDVFETALTKLSTLRDSTKLGPWLAAIARNRALDLRRSASRWRTEPIGEDIEDSMPTPSANAELTRVLRALNELPETYRETLVLRLIEGLSGPEIAEQVGMTAESVRVNLHRGMKILRERLKTSDADGDGADEEAEQA
jgi:RNA polymerase sigma-70 factor, ECF subfamily